MLVYQAFLNKDLFNCMNFLIIVMALAALKQLFVVNNVSKIQWACESLKAVGDSNINYSTKEPVSDIIIQEKKHQSI